MSILYRYKADGVTSLPAGKEVTLTDFHGKPLNVIAWYVIIYCESKDTDCNIAHTSLNAMVNGSFPVESGTVATPSRPLTIASAGLMGTPALQAGSISSRKKVGCASAQITRPKAVLLRSDKPMNEA
jgi:hypothetical protein